jgi:hypothetical protein
MAKIAFPKLYYILSSSSSSTNSRKDGPSDPSAQLWRLEAHISLGEQFGRPHPQALANNFASLDRLRFFLLMYFVSSSFEPPWKGSSHLSHSSDLTPSVSLIGPNKMKFTLQVLLEYIRD